MTEINFSDLIKAAQSPQVTTNANSINDIMSNLEKFLNQGDKIVNFIEKLEQRPSVSLLIRQAADKQKLSLEPLSKPVSEKIVEVGVRPLTLTHEEMFKQLNTIPEEKLKQMIEAMKNNEVKS